MTRIFLSIVGVIYVILAGWCAIQPQRTADSIGLTLQEGSGQSEYLTVYGGMQLAAGLLFLWPLLRPDATPWMLATCITIHACLVLFRTTGFLLFSGISPITYVFAGIEWAVFLGSAFILWMTYDAAFGSTSH